MAENSKIGTVNLQNLKIIVVGATSGIGRALYGQYIEQGYRVGVVGRRKHLLDQMQSNYPEQTFCRVADIAQPDEAKHAIDELTAEMGGVDRIVVCAGTGEINPELKFEMELPTLLTNVIGWTAVVDQAFAALEQQGAGHLVLITSLGGLRGEPSAPAYSASKAYQINYTEALRKKAYKNGNKVFVTDIRPGLVDTDMAKGDGLFWVMPLPKVVAQIDRAIEHKVQVAVVTRRWKWVGCVMKWLPFALYKNL